MPSKKKTREREEKLMDDGWFAITSDIWREPGEILQKLKIIADANFPIQLVRLLRKRKFDVKTAQSLGWDKLSDKHLLQRVSKRGCVLITFDRDFWSDLKFPLHYPGSIIFIDGKDERIGRTEGFDLLCAFLLNYGGGWSRRKFRATSVSVLMKGISFENKKYVYEMRILRGGVYAREVEGFEY